MILGADGKPATTPAPERAATPYDQVVADFQVFMKIPREDTPENRGAARAQLSTVLDGFAKTTSHAVKNAIDYEIQTTEGTEGNYTIRVESKSKRGEAFLGDWQGFVAGLHRAAQEGRVEQAIGQLYQAMGQHAAVIDQLLLRVAELEARPK